MKIKYVVGFVFNGNGILLIRKNRGPHWMVGKLNGVGGKVEDGESYLEAMEREFIEETGCPIPVEWVYATEIEYSNCVIQFFFTKTDIQSVDLTPEDEELVWLDFYHDNVDDLVYNLHHIIPIVYDVARS